VRLLDLASRCDGPVTAPVAVLGNSLGTTTTMWSPQLEPLSAQLRLVRWDLPGHGASQGRYGRLTVDTIGDAVIAVLDDLGVARAGFCGVSLGGMVGLSVAARYPDRVDRLAVCCTSAYLGAAPAWYERAAAVRADGMASIADRVMAGWFTRDFLERRADIVAVMRDEFVAADVEGYARCCEAIATMDLRPALLQVRCPTLVISGADDHAIPPEHGAAIAAAIGGSRFVSVDHAAHLATIERADVTTALLLDHFVTS
jgi:3-oxoadipate enol-lactonase